MIMKNEKETREKLLSCAKEEFMEKGFQNASLRQICSKAGVTTGAVYFFFKDKDGLFSALVEPTYQGVLSALIHHLQEDMEEDLATYVHKPGDHDPFVEELIHVLYQNHDAVTLLISKSTGSKYEHVVEEFIEMIEKNFMGLSENYARSVPGKQLNRPMVHWLSHLSIMTFVHLLTHIKDEKKALRFMKPAMEHLILGWMNFILEDKEK